MIKDSTAFAIKRKLNTIIRCSSFAEVLQGTKEPEGYKGYVFDTCTSSTISMTEEAFAEGLNICRATGKTLLVDGAEHLSGVSMYQIWEALSNAIGYHPDFHMILVVSEDAPIEHLDSLFRQMFAIVNPDGTFYKEPEDG